MKFGFRIPSVKERISARLSPKRIVRHSMGVKVPGGMGIFTNPKKAIYNKIYNKTTFGLGKVSSKSNKKNNIKEEFIEKNNVNSELDRHFTLIDDIVCYYRKRNKEDGMLEKAIDACKKQISLATKTSQLFKKEYPNSLLPSHTGYKKLAIIYYNQGKYRDVIDLCNQAKNQGWNGDWDKRIERCKSKI